MKRNFIFKAIIVILSVILGINLISLTFAAPPSSGSLWEQILNSPLTISPKNKANIEVKNSENTRPVGIFLNSASSSATESFRFLSDLLDNTGLAVRCNNESHACVKFRVLDSNINSQANVAVLSLETVDNEAYGLYIDFQNPIGGRKKLINGGVRISGIREENFTAYSDGALQMGQCLGMESPNGSLWRIKFDDNGNLITESGSC